MMEITIFIIVIFLALHLVIQDAWKIWRKRQSKSKRTSKMEDDYRASSKTSMLYEYGDNDLSHHIQNIEKKMSDIIQELNRINATQEHINNIYGKICMIEQFVDSLKASHKYINQEKTEKSDTSKHVNQKTYYVGTWKGSGLFTDAKDQNFPEAKFKIITDDNEHGELIPLELSKFRSSEVNETVISKTKDSCDFNKATNMDIDHNGKVVYEYATNYWRIKEPCVVKLTK